VPGSQFVAYLAPERRVNRLGPLPAAVPRPELLGDRPRILLSGDGSLAWVDSTLLSGFPGAAVLRLPSDAAGVKF